MSSRRLQFLCAAAVSALLVAGCGSDDEPSAEPDPSLEAASSEEGADGGEEGDAGGVPAGYVEPDYEGLPEDLTSDEVCALIDEATITEALGTEVTRMTPGTSQPDCQWFYKLEGGPATNLQVQVMSMDQTDERLGTEALEWALERAPSDAEIVDVDGLDVPSASYEVGVSTVYFAIDPVGRIFTVSVHSESPEAGRVELVSAVLEALEADHT